MACTESRSCSRPCYTQSLRLAAAHQLRSIAFPSISTGAYSYPRQQAAQIAIRTVQGHPNIDQSFDQVIFCCYSREDFALYQSLLNHED